MKGKTKLKLILIMLVIMAASLIAGCQIGRDDLQTYLQKNNLTASITYYGNGGIFRDNTNLTSVQLYYHDNDPVINITTDSDSVIEFARTNYVFNRWEIAEVDDDGNLVYEDAEKTIIKTTGVIDLSTYIIHSNEHLSVVAIWGVDVLLNYRLAGDTSITVNVTNDNGDIVPTVYRPGDIIYQRAYGASGRLYITDAAPAISVTDATYLEYFTDEACEYSAIGESLSKPDNGQNGDIYVKYTAGLWTVVKTRSNVVAMFSGMHLSGNRYYIYNDIDCSGGSFGLRSASQMVNCTINGNNHTISNLTFSGLNISPGENYSIFGTFGSSANISDLTFEDVTFTSSIKSGYVNLYLINSDFVDGCTFKNFDIINAEMNITEFPINGSGITNIPYVETSYTTNNWIFGGVANDDEFNITDREIQITNASLKIKDDIVASNVGYSLAAVRAVKMPYYINRKENT